MPKGRGERDGRSLVGVLSGMITSEKELQDIWTCAWNKEAPL
jgi:hypothetical protein